MLSQARLFFIAKIAEEHRQESVCCEENNENQQLNLVRKFRNFQEVTASLSSIKICLRKCKNLLWESEKTGT